MSPLVCNRCGGSGCEPDWTVLGNRARKRRLRLDLSQRQAARRIHATAAYLCDLEYGRRAWGGKKARAYLKLLGIRS